MHGGGGLSPGPHRVEVDSIVLSRQRLQFLGAQGLGSSHQGHILWAAEEQAVKTRSPPRQQGGEEEEELDPGGTAHLTVPSPNHPVVKLRQAGELCFQDPGRLGVCTSQAVASVVRGSGGSDLCTRPSSASEASRAANRRHLCSRPPCCRRSTAAVRRSGRSISHSGLRGHRAQRPEPPPHAPLGVRSHLLVPEQPGGCHFLVVHERRPHGPAAPGKQVGAPPVPCGQPRGAAHPPAHNWGGARGAGHKRAQPRHAASRRPQSQSAGWPRLPAS